MNIHRIRLTNYRGIEESEVRFSTQGITIVEGPNEVGKTSLGEAIGILFDYMDSSKRSDVKAIKPVSVDAGPEIELEAETGPYKFTYFKRFHKKPATTLEISSPKPESHTGREAHERADEILQETIDVDLWKTLRIQQGDAIQQADLSKQTSLSTALDIAAGGQSTDARDETLFDKVRDEYERYFTANGSEKKTLKEARESLEQASSEVVSIERQIQDLESDITRAADLEKDLVLLKSQEEGLRKDVAGYTESLNEINRLESVLETASLKLESAQKSEDATAREKKEREKLILNVSNAREAKTELEESNATAMDSLNTAERDLEKTQSVADEAESKRQEIDSLVRLYRADFDCFNNRLHLEQLEERKGRIDNALKEAATAEELLAKNGVDEDSLESIQKAERALISAQAKLETGAPSVLLRGLEDVELIIDEKPSSISKEEERHLPVSDRVRVAIPGSLEVEVIAGSSSSELSRMVQEAKQDLETLCDDCGADNADEARSAFDARKQAQRSVEEHSKIEEENLRDLTYEELEKKVISLNKTVPSYLEDRVAESVFPATIEGAEKLMQEAELHLEKISSSCSDTRSKLDTARKVRDKLSERHQAIRVEFDLKTEELVRSEDELARSREATSDDGLESNYAKAIAAVKAEKESVESTDSELRDKNPDQIKALAETATGSLKTTEKKRDSAQSENTEVRARLKISGEEGLHEKLDLAYTHRAHLDQENTSLFRRAEAARFLYTTMKEERDKARRAYVAPLKEKIERLGRLVFDQSFEVELNENLSVESRTMKGSTVAFDSLSGGTKEQIALISRLACAMTVSEEGGATLILDDALGYTDSGRLKLMGAVLAKAAKECQIIILTCVPERYSNVGEATVVRLG